LNAADPATRGWFVISAGSVTRLAIGLIASVIVARTFGPANLGIYATLAAVAATVGAFGEFGLTESAVRRIAVNWPASPEAARSTAASYVWLRGGASLLVVAALVLSLPLGAALGLLPARQSLVLLALLGVVATGLSGAVSGILQATGRFTQLTLVMIGNAALTAIAAIVLRLSGMLTLTSALIVLGIGTSLASFALGLRLLPGALDLAMPKRTVLRSEGRKLFGFGLWLWLANSLAMVAAQLDLLLAGHWLAPAAVGTYALAVSLASKASVLNQSLHAALLPFASSLKSREAVTGYLRRGLVRSAAIALLLLLAVPLARPVIPLIFGSGYAPSVTLFLALLGVALFDLFAAPILLLAFSADQPKLIAGADALRVVVLVIAAVALVPMIGAFGLVLAKLASSVAGFALTVIVLGSRQLRASRDGQASPSLIEP
jgi:O-antigen/teichoic acid export membrane protein